MTLTVTGDPIQVLSADGVTPINSGDSLDFGTASVDFFGRGPVPVRGPFFLKNLSNGPVQVVVTGDLRDDIVPLFGSTIEDLKPAPGNAFTLAAPGTTGDTLRGFLGLKFLAPTAGSKQTTIIFRATATGDLGADVCSGGGGCIVVASSNDNRVYIYDPVNLNLLAAVGSGDLTFPQSVAIGPDSRVYVGTSGQVIAIDLTTGDAVSLGAGILGGFIYGTTVSTGGIIYASGSSMVETRTLTLTGVHAGNIASPNGSNLRSTAFGPDGSFYLTSFSGGPVQRWSPGFVFQGPFGGGGLSSAFGVAVRSNGEVVVASQNNAAYYVFSSVGTFLRSVNVNCAGQIRNIAVDGWDSIWVGCFGHNAVVKFNAQDVEVARIQVNTPSGVSILPTWEGPTATQPTATQLAVTGSPRELEGPLPDGTSR